MDQKEIIALLNAVHAGIQATGLASFINNNGVELQWAVNKLQNRLQEIEAQDVEAEPEAE